MGMNSAGHSPAFQAKNSSRLCVGRRQKRTNGGTGAPDSKPKFKETGMSENFSSPAPAAELRCYPFVKK